ANDGIAHAASWADQHVEHASRQTRAADDLGQGPGRGWHQFGRFEYYAVAEAQCWRDLPGGDGNREVTRRDDANHPQWLSEYVNADVLAHRLVFLALGAQLLLGIELERAPGAVDFTQRSANDLAFLTV